MLTVSSIVNFCKISVKISVLENFEKSWKNLLTQLATLATFSSLCERITWCGCPVSLSNSSEAESNSSSRTQKRGFIMPCLCQLTRQMLVCDDLRSIHYESQMTKCIFFKFSTLLVASNVCCAHQRSGHNCKSCVNLWLWWVRSMSVCLSTRISPPHTRSLLNFLYMLPMSMARSSTMLRIGHIACRL